MRGAGDRVLRASGLALGYEATTVLAGVDLEVRAGEYWVLVGPNGAGKTTLLRAVLGLLEPSAGRLELDPERMRWERLGFVPQRGGLHTALPVTVREFVSLGFVGLRGARRERAARLAWALERCGLAGHARTGWHALSGGQRQRALLARALVRRPSVLLLDEPTEGLDLRSRSGLLELLAELHREEGLTLLVVTHELAIAARYATHVALFREGGVAAGPRAAVLRPEEIRRAFGVDAEIVLDGAAPPAGAGSGRA